jgi:hypothetical protein
MRHQIVEWSARINRDPQNAQLAGELLEIDNRIKSVIDQLVQEKIRIGCDFAVYAPQVNSKLVALASFVGSSETLPPLNIVRCSPNWPLALIGRSGSLTAS